MSPYRFYGHLVTAAHRHIRLPDVEANALKQARALLDEMESAATREERQKVATKYGTSLPELRELVKRYEERVKTASHFTPTLLDARSAESGRTWDLISARRNRKARPNSTLLATSEAYLIRKNDLAAHEKYLESLKQHREKDAA